MKRAVILICVLVALGLGSFGLVLRYPHLLPEAFVLHWKSLKRQIRVRGLVEREDGAVADAYYAGRPLGSRIGAWASKQSQPLGSRQELVDRVAAETERLGETPERPSFWGGFRIRPLEMEFWADGEFRLHNRFRWTRSDENAPWETQRLYP